MDNNLAAPQSTKSEGSGWRRNRFFKSTINKAVLYGGSASIAQLIMMVYTLFVARWLGPAEYSIFAAAYSICTLTAFIFNWGLDTWMLRQGSITSDTSSLLSSVLELKGALGLGWIALMVSIIPVLRPDLFFPAILLIAALDIWADSVMNTGLSTLNLLDRIPNISALLIISRGGRLISALILVIGGQDYAFWFVIGRSAATLIGFLLTMWLLKSYIRWTKFQPGLLWRKSSAFGLSEFLAIVYAQVDVSLLALIGEKNAVGIYAPAISLLNGLFILPNAGYILLIPILSKKIQQNPNAAKQIALVSLLAFTLLGTVLMVGIAWLSPWVISIILGQAYQPTILLITILSPILLFKAIEFCLAAIIIGANQQQKRLLPQLLSALINIILDIIAIPIYGPVGAAVVYVFSELVLLIGYGIITFRWWKSAKPSGNLATET